MVKDIQHKGEGTTTPLVTPSDGSEEHDDDGSAGLSPITTISDFCGSSFSPSSEDAEKVIKMQRKKDLQEDAENHLNREVVVGDIRDGMMMVIERVGNTVDETPMTFPFAGPDGGRGDALPSHTSCFQYQHLRQQHQIPPLLVRNNKEVASVPYPAPLTHSLLSASSSSSHFGLLPTSPLTAKTATAATGHTPATGTDCRREVANTNVGSVWPCGVVAQQQMELLLHQLATTQTLLAQNTNYNNNNNRRRSDQNSKAVNENDRRNQIACADQHQTHSEQVRQHYPTLFQTSTPVTNLFDGPITRPIANDVDDDDTELIAFSKRQNHSKQLKAFIQSLEHFNGDVPDASLSANEASRMMHSGSSDALKSSGSSDNDICYDADDLYSFQKGGRSLLAAGDQALDSAKKKNVLKTMSEQEQQHHQIQLLSVLQQKHQQQYAHHDLFTSPIFFHRHQFHPNGDQHKPSSGSTNGSNIISPASEDISLHLEDDVGEERSLVFKQNCNDTTTDVVINGEDVKQGEDRIQSQQQEPQLSPENFNEQQQESPAPQYFSLLSLPSLLSKPPAMTFQSSLSAVNRDTTMDSMVPHGSSTSSEDSNNTGVNDDRNCGNLLQPQLELQRPPPEALKTAVPVRKKKKPYKELTLEEKVELIRLAERCANLSQASIAERYAIAKSNVCRILQRKDEYLQAFQQSGCVAGSRKRKLRSLISDNSSSSNFPGINNNIRETEVVVDGTAAGRGQTTVIATRFGDDIKLDELMMKEVVKNGVTMKTNGDDSTNNSNQKEEEESERVNNDDNNSNFDVKMDAHRLFGASDTLRLHMGAEHDVSRLLMCRCCNWAFGDKHSLNTHVKLRKEGSLNAPHRDDADKGGLHNTDTGDNNREHIEGGHQYHHFHRHLSPQQHQHQKRRRHHSLSPVFDQQSVNNNDSNNTSEESTTGTTTGLQHSNAAGARKRARGRSSIAPTANINNDNTNKNDVHSSHNHKRHFATKSALSPAPSTKIANNNSSVGISHPIPLKPAAHHPPLLQNPEQQHLHLFNKNQYHHQHNPLLLLPQLPPLQLGGPWGQQERSKHPLFVTDTFNAGSDASVLQQLFLLQQQHRQTQQQQQQRNQMIQNQQQFLPFFPGIGRSSGDWFRQQQQQHSQQDPAAFLMKNEEQDQEDENGDVRGSTIVREGNFNDEREVGSGTVIRCSTTSSSSTRTILHQTTSPTGVVVVFDDKGRSETPQQPEQLQRTAVDGCDNRTKTPTAINIINDNNKLFTNVETEEEKRSQNAVVEEKEQKPKAETTTISIGSHSPPQPATTTISMTHYSISASASSCSSSPPAPSSSATSSSSSSIGGEASSCKGAEGGWSFASSTTSSSSYSPEGGPGATLSSSPSSSSSSSSPSSSAKEEEKPSPLYCCCMKRRPTTIISTQINQNNQTAQSVNIDEKYQKHSKDARQQQHKRNSEGEGHGGGNSATCQHPKVADSGVVVSFLNNNKEVPLCCDQCPVLEERLALSSSRLAYLDLCRLNCQNELLRLSARVALSDQCARKLEIEARQWKERSEMLTIRLLECREKVLALVGQQKQQQGGAHSPLWPPVAAEQLIQFQFLADVLKLTLV